MIDMLAQNMDDSAFTNRMAELPTRRVGRAVNKVRTREPEDRAAPIRSFTDQSLQFFGIHQRAPIGEETNVKAYVLRTPAIGETSEFTPSAAYYYSVFERSLEASSAVHEGLVQATLARITSLRAIAREEETSISSASERDLKHFLKLVRLKVRPYIALLENTNLRAVWKGSDGSQVGLQFLGDSKVQFVVLASRQNGFVAHASGRDELTKIPGLVYGLGLRSFFAQ